MYYYAFINGNGIATLVYEMPVEMEESKGFIGVSKEVYTASKEGTEGSVIGMHWNATKRVWEEVTKYYYAVITQKNFRKEVTAEDEIRYFVKEVVESDEKIDDPLYIQVDGLDSTCVGQLYNSDTAGFTKPEFVEEAFTDTDYISVNGKNEALTDKLEELESAIENIHIPEVTAESIKEKLKAVDGEGSGLDADLLDGKDATYFATDEGLKALETKVTAASILEKLKTVDGASSGLDADLLDGKDSTYFATTQNLKDLTTAVNGKAAANHAHTNYASTVTTTGSGNAITAISQSGNTITATKGASYALSNHTHAVASNCAVIEGDFPIELSNASRVNTVVPVYDLEQVGGWSKVNNCVIVPKTGTYLVSLKGYMYMSKKPSSTTAIRVKTNLSINDSEGTFIGYTYFTTGGNIAESSFSLDTNSGFKILSLNKGDKIGIKVEMYNGNGAVTCSGHVFPQIAMIEV